MSYIALSTLSISYILIFSWEVLLFFGAPLIGRACWSVICLRITYHYHTNRLHDFFKKNGFKCLYIATHLHTF